MRPSHRPLAGLLLAAALPLSAAAAEPAEQAVVKGTLVSLDLSRVPTSLTRRGAATCLGSRVTATGEGEVVPCQRPFTFDGPVAGDPVVLRFRPKDGGRPTRVEFPYARDPRPRTFAAPADGVVSLEAPPPPKEKAAPLPLAPEVRALAQAAAAAACGECRGARDFALKDFTVEELRAPAQDLVLTFQAPGPR
ncbi:MAG: hypothetical protein NDI82_05665 [Anaeromyxobacteraceae bacterium]|nr:hypothetical protein [Anaeromyxobacteraceae bacterium]